MKETFGLITGSGFYKFAEEEDFNIEVFKTPFGIQEVFIGEFQGRELAWIPRHGTRHERKASVLNPRAMIHAMMQIGVVGILGSSVTGIIKEDIPTAEPILFDDLYFPHNRLPDGQLCTFFNKLNMEVAHLVFDKPFSGGLREIVKQAAERAGVNLIDGGVYAHSVGPRFETATEIRLMKMIGCTCVSMTAGFEAILSAEIRIPYALIGFGINYATGVSQKVTPLEELKENLAQVPKKLKPIVTEICRGTEIDDLEYDTGYIH